jgi:mRNA-degrading endonuclease RelE of RelBE toxin-antitoxin system
MASDPQPSVAIYYTPEFKRNVRHLAKKYAHVRGDLEPLLQSLLRGQREGDKVPGVKYDVYKVRLKNSGARKGKSGGYRVIFQVRNAGEIVLITIYSKSEQGDISAKAIKRIIDEVERR